MVITTSLDFMGAAESGVEGFRYLNFTLFHLAFLLTLVSTICSILMHQKIRIPSASIWFPLLAFLLLYTISLIRTPDIKEASLYVVRAMFLSMTIFIVIISIDRIWKLSLFVGMLIIVPLVVASITISQFFSEGSLFAPIVIKMANALGLPVFRATGTFTNPNALACFLMAGAALGFSLLFAKEIPSFLRLILLAAVITTVVGLLLSFSRGGWVSTFCAVIFVVVLQKKWSYFGYFAIFVIICLIIISIKTPQMYAVVFERLGSIFDPSQDASSTARIALLKSSVAMWFDHPIFGVGLRGFPVEFANYIDPNMPHILKELKEAHTIQFEILAEMGIVGLTIASWLFFTVLFHGIRTMKTIKNHTLRCLQIGSVALFIGYVINFTFATDLFNNVFWMTMGMIYTLPLIDNKYFSEQSLKELPQPTPG
ncbi:MAG: O-antigen ligase family protein [Candidatus Latescibacterota bacterium]